MADCEVLEKDCSHFIPGLFGSLISTVLIALSLFAFDGRMALAALWVIPVSAAIVVGSYRVQDKVQARTMAAKMACADGIQEYIETLRDLKASNAEQRYLSGLSDKFGLWKSSPLRQSWKRHCSCPLRAWCSSWALHRWHSPARCCWCRAALMY